MNTWDWLSFADGIAFGLASVWIGHSAWKGVEKLIHAIRHYIDTFHDMRKWVENERYRQEMKREENSRKKAAEVPPDEQEINLEDPVEIEDEPEAC